MRKVGILVLAFALVIGMSFGVMAQEDLTGETRTEAEQIGDNNIIRVSQNDHPRPFENNIFQYGNRNLINVNQTGDSGVLDVMQYDSYDSVMNISQGNSWNHEAILRQKYTNETTINLDQKSAKAYVRQKNEEDSVINITQDGFGTFPKKPYRGDYVQVLQKNGSGNVVNINQDSETNNDLPRSEAFVTQEQGSANVVNIIQNGRNHLTDIYQTGDNNAANVSQFNENNSVEISQDGDDNTINVSQGE